MGIFFSNVQRLDFPAHWVNHAIPYSQLKKCLKKVARELHELGLDPETLRELLNPDATSPVALKYKLNGTNLVLPTVFPSIKTDFPQTAPILTCAQSLPFKSIYRMVSPSTLRLHQTRATSLIRLLLICHKISGRMRDILPNRKPTMM